MAKDVLNKRYMRKGQDLIAEFPGLVIIHQKIPGREVGRHQHQEHEFFLPLQGEITLRFEGKEVSARPGKLLYTPPALEHSFSSDTKSGDGERVIFLVKDSLWKSCGGGKLKPLVVPASSLVRELLFYLLLNPKVKGISVFIKALVSALSEHFSLMSGCYNDQGALSLATGAHYSGNIKDTRIKKAVEFLQELEEQPSMPELAKMCGLSLRNFNRIFSMETGMTPKQYSTIIRVERAKTLLATTELTITDIAQEVGYQSLSKFIGVFQKSTGKLPSEYREFELSSKRFRPNRKS